MRLMNTMTALAVAVGAALSAAAALADYPERGVTMVVPFTAGGPTDTLARAVARGMEGPLGANIIVENKPGAAGNIGTLDVVRAKPDGYMIVFASSGPMFINTTLYAKAGFDPRTDLTPLEMVGTMPNVVAVNPKLGVSDLKGFMDYAKANEGVSYGSSGAGSTNHIMGFLLNKEVDDRMMHVPYPGTSQAVTDLLGGHISVLFFDVLTAKSYVESGKLTALAIASPERSAALPNVPTFAEQGVKMEDLSLAFGILGPKGLPDDIVEKLRGAIEASLDSPEVSSLMANQGVERTPAMSRPDLAAHISAEVDRWGNVVRQTGATIN